ncbi:hypothetical protein Tco_0741065, partial [Tanacetum coccineum]
MNISFISELIKPTLEGRLKKAQEQLSYLTTPIRKRTLKNPYLICDIRGGAYEANECDSNTPREQGEEGPEWVVRSKFEDKLANFMLEKDLHAKGLGEILNQQRSEMHNQFSQILTTFEKTQAPTPIPDAPTFAITTISGVTTRHPPYPTPSNMATVDNNLLTETIEEKGGPKGEELTTVQNEGLLVSYRYHPSKSSSVPFPSRLKKQKKDDDDERLLSIFRQIHVNLPFLEAMIHMPKGAKVLKDLLSHKEKLEKVASLVKLSEECSAVIQRSLPQKEEELGNFTLP